MEAVIRISLKTYRKRPSWSRSMGQRRAVPTASRPKVYAIRQRWCRARKTACRRKSKRHLAGAILHAIITSSFHSVVRHPRCPCRLGHRTVDREPFL